MALDSTKKKLDLVFKVKGQKFTYIYDFGDDWIHKITLEEILPGDGKKATLLSGKGACPPEDCGGPYGYEEMLKTLSSPKHEEYEELREWLGLVDDEVWDTKEFDLEMAKNL